MLKGLIVRAVRVVDNAGVETVLTLAFVAQFAANTLPMYGVDAVRLLLVADGEVVETGTVVQMPASASAGRTMRASAGRESRAVARTPTTPSPKPARVRRPEPVDDELGTSELEQARAVESAVRITIIGPDGEPRTKIVRRSGSRDGMAAPARRPHD